MPREFSSGEVSLHLHPCIIVGVLPHVLIFYFITWLLESSIKPHQFSLTISFSTWCHIKGMPCFYSVTQCVGIGTKGWCTENSSCNWHFTAVLGGWKKVHKIDNGLLSYFRTLLPPLPTNPMYSMQHLAQLYALFL